MELTTVQKTLLEYLKGNHFFSMLLPFSAVITLVYCIYNVLSNITFLTFVSKFYAISGILFIAYAIGLIISFAKNDMLIIMIAFALMALSNVLEFFVFGNIVPRISSIIDVIIYGALAYMAMLRYNKTGGKLQ